MLEPVLGRIISKGKLWHGNVGDVLVQVQQDTKTCLSDECVRSCHRNMIPAGNCGAFFTKADRGQEFFDREMRKLDYLVGFNVDKGKQCGTRGKHRFHWIFQAPILAKCRDLPRLEIECKELCQFLDSERAGNHCDTLDQASRKFPVCVIDLVQRAFIRLIECRWQFVQSTLDTSWKAFAKIVQLTINPSEPTRDISVRVVKERRNQFLTSHPLFPSGH